MKSRTSILVVAIALVGLVVPPAPIGAADNRLPARLSDKEFWQLFSDASETGGAFRSDNLVSNEVRFQTVIPGLLTLTPGGAYLGVGPEQNFTYIAALKPKIAFIVDVRRGNADLHLMYKALFELSETRADFVARLFSRTKAEGLTTSSTAAQLLDAVAKVEPNERIYSQNLATLRNHLVTVHGFPLASEDLERIAAIAHAFFLMGPGIQYSPYGSFGGTVQPTYRELMVETDGLGQARSYLSSEAAYATVRDLERRNAVVPIVGDFAGPKALRAIGTYLRQKSAVVAAFYLSNVEEYLQQQHRWPAFCANAAALPIDRSSRFVRAIRPKSDNSYEGFSFQLSSMSQELASCATVPAS
jgi:hypothetical protein